jgi:hypothetical protein
MPKKMSKSFRDFATTADLLRKGIVSSKVSQIQSKQVLSGIRDLVEYYFRELRESYFSPDSSNVELVALDSYAQQLLELTHKHPAAAKVTSILKNVISHSRKIDVYITVNQSNNSVQIIGDIDTRIIDTLEKLVPSAALSYKQALIDLSLPARLSWRGPATDLREALRELLDHLAPDSDVTAAANFKLEPETKGPTMKQKVRFILSKRGVSRSASAVPEGAAASVEESLGAFVRSLYTRSSVSTHTPTEKNEVTMIRDWVRVTLCELLEIGT